jgi:hypothetical protein
VNDKVYIHEFIDIIGRHRSDYVYHMLANYSPIAQDERGQQCFGVWGTIGSTGRWPQVVNLWEENGFDGLAASFGHETGNPAMQDPKLAQWWARAARFRSGGPDRILVPAPWSRPIDALVGAGVRGVVYAHELVVVPPGQAVRYLDGVGDLAPGVTASFGWQLAGAWRTAMSDDSECLILDPELAAVGCVRTGSHPDARPGTSRRRRGALGPTHPARRRTAVADAHRQATVPCRSPRALRRGLTRRVRTRRGARPRQCGRSGANRTAGARSPYGSAYSESSARRWPG